MLLAALNRKEFLFFPTIWKYAIVLAKKQTFIRYSSMDWIN